MEKPTTLKIKEFRENLVKVVNESELPPFLVKYEVDKVVNEINILAMQEEQAELKAYEESERSDDIGISENTVGE